MSDDIFIVAFLITTLLCMSQIAPAFAMAATFLAGMLFFVGIHITDKKSKKEKEKLHE